MKPAQRMQRFFISTKIYKIAGGDAVMRSRPPAVLHTALRFLKSSVRFFSPPISGIKYSLPAVVMAALTLFGADAQADNIRLFNTGVDATGKLLTNGTTGDPHYTLYSVPMG